MIKSKANLNGTLLTFAPSIYQGKKLDYFHLVQFFYCLRNGNISSDMKNVHAIKGNKDGYTISRKEADFKQSQINIVDISDSSEL